MCGICGFVGKSTASFDILYKMNATIEHRGPDGEGYLIDEGTALGHRRLSLIDLEGGSQPMTRGHMPEDETFSPGENCTIETVGRYSIVFNGEIYNYKELKEKLESYGWKFSKNSDTEVLLVGYIAWGEIVLKKIRGMFSFAIWDSETEELFCARDFFGIKPFYYTMCSDDTFIFASEAKAILEHPSYHKELNESALVSYMTFQFPASLETFFKGIFRLPAGHCLRVKNGNVELNRYWHMEYEPNELRANDATEMAIRQAMSDSVLYHNVADVEVGSFLSSGVDSSYLTSLLVEENPDIHTFTVGFSEYEGERDEVAWAEELADILKVENDSERISEEDFWEAIPHVLWHMDEPLGDPSAVALYFVDKLAAKKVKAVLSGEGADELFGGYRIYNTPIANKRISWLPRPLLSFVADILEKLHIRGSAYLRRAMSSPREWYYTNANGAAFSEYELLEVFNGHMRTVMYDTPKPLELVSSSYDEIEGSDEVTQMQYVDIMHWLEGDILLKTDKMSMAHSLESRVPFLDREVAKVASTLTTSQKVDEKNTKIAMRNASEKVIPQAWAQKEKLGFPVPLAEWLKHENHIGEIRTLFAGPSAKKFFDTGELRHIVDVHVKGEKDYSRKIWIVYAFLMWYDLYLLGREDPHFRNGEAGPSGG